MLIRALVVGLALTAVSARADAQLRRGTTSPPPARPAPAVSLMGGPSPYDLAGTGTGWAAAVGINVPSGRVLIFEPGVTFFHYRSDAGNGITYVIPEVSFQVQVPARAVRPYVGVGAGFAEFLSGRGSTLATLHAAAGLRLDVGAKWGARGEVRLRSIDPFKGHTTDLMFGISHRLGNRGSRD